MTELSPEDHVRAIELKHRLEGSTSVQSALIQQYNSLCAMGAFEQAEVLRPKIHDYMDVFLDSCAENSKLMRRFQGLS